jgi:hypothetical protein
MTVHRLEVPRFCLVERDSIGVIVTLFHTRFCERLQVIPCYLSRVGSNCAPISTGFPCEGEVTVLTGPTSYRELWPSFHEWIRTCAHVSFLWVTLFKKLDLESLPRLPWSYSRL